MRAIWVLTTRELKSLFLSPVAYVVLAVFNAIVGWFFFNLVTIFIILSLQSLRLPWLAERITLHDIVIKPLFGNTAVILLFMVPMITMRSFAEEKKTGTFELLYTSPITVWQIVLGKFFGAMIFVLVLIALSLQYIVYLEIFGEPDLGVIALAYFGMVLMASAFVAVGILASSITENQVIAVIVSFGILLAFWVVGWAREVASGTLKDIISYLSFIDHYQNFTDGLLDTRDIIYYLSFTFFVLFVTWAVLESRRWRGAY